MRSDGVLNICLTSFGSQFGAESGKFGGDVMLMSCLYTELSILGTSARLSRISVEGDSHGRVDERIGAKDLF